MVLQIFPHGTICIFLGAYIEAKGAGHRCVSSVMVSGNLSFSQMIYIGELGRWNRTEAVLGGIGNPVVQSHMESSFCFFCSDYN